MGRFARALLLVLAFLGLGSPRAARGQDRIAPEIRRLLDDHRAPGSIRPALSGQDTLLDALYAARGDSALWLDGTAFDQHGRAAIVVLNAAAERGLDPRDYDARVLDSLADFPDDTTAAGLAARDLLLSVAVARYLRDLKDGRVPDTPFDRQHQMITAAESRALLQRVAAGAPVEALAREVEPHLAQYRNLLLRLAEYRALASTFRYRPLRRARVRLGGSYVGAHELRRRLVAFGDLPDTALADVGERYDSTLADGVRRFQLRHALTPDGRLGPATFDALAVPIRRRVRQIQYALERLRWLPALEGQRLVVVNIPSFELFAFDSIGGTGAPVLQMPVAIGSAFDHRTPVLYSPLRAVQFRPYWNVPRTLVVKELIPAIRRDTTFLRRNQMELLAAGDTVAGDSVTPGILRALARGTLRVRQRPGPWNSLGVTKFTFQNNYDVYLHGTPDTGVFHLARRDLSHGCIRLQDPAALAAWALAGDATWSPDAIHLAMQGNADTVRARIPRPTGVLILYTTAIAMPDGTVRFYDDIYGHDAELARALRVTRVTGSPPPAR